MGLGKTLTMISLVTKQKQLQGNKDDDKEEEKEDEDWMSKDKHLKKRTIYYI